MGRSVSTPTNAFAVAYQHWDCEDELEFEDNIEMAVTKAMHMFPSMDKCNKVLGREDRAILENDFGYFGISEYCGLVSIWMVIKEEQEDNNLANWWATKAKPKLIKELSELNKIGTMSNGEAVFEVA